MDRLTFRLGESNPSYGLEDKASSKPGLFTDYDGFFAHLKAVHRLGQYEDTGLTPEEIVDGQMFSEWISVEDRLPTLDETGYTYVLVCMSDEFITAADYTRNEGFGLWEDSGEVTHWMPLPEPPKGE